MLGPRTLVSATPRDLWQDILTAGPETLSSTVLPFCLGRCMYCSTRFATGRIRLHPSAQPPLQTQGPTPPGYSALNPERAQAARARLEGSFGLGLTFMFGLRVSAMRSKAWVFQVLESTVSVAFSAALSSLPEFFLPTCKSLCWKPPRLLFWPTAMPENRKPEQGSTRLDRQTPT